MLSAVSVVTLTSDAGCRAAWNSHTQPQRTGETLRGGDGSLGGQGMWLHLFIRPSSRLNLSAWKLSRRRGLLNILRIILKQPPDWGICGMGMDSGPS